jgi:hypothetical protein
MNHRPVAGIRSARNWRTWRRRRTVVDMIVFSHENSAAACECVSCHSASRASSLVFGSRFVRRNGGSARSRLIERRRPTALQTFGGGSAVRPRQQPEGRSAAMPADEFHARVLPCRRDPPHTGGDEAQKEAC